MKTWVERCGWPPSRAGEALETLALRGGLARRSERRSRSASLPGEDLSRDLASAALASGVELEALAVAYGELQGLMSCRSPWLASFPTPAGPRLMAVLSGGRRCLRLLGPDLRLRSVACEAVAAALRGPVEETALPAVEALLELAEVRGRRRERARRALLAERLQTAQVPAVWGLRLPLASEGKRLLAESGLGRQLLRFASFYALGYACLLASWWVLGRGALAGQLGPDWLFAWALLLLGLVPTRMASIWAQARLTAGAGTLLKRRLLQGALKLSTEEVRGQGAAQLLAQVLEADTLEFYALHGGILSVAALIDLGLAAVVLGQGMSAGATLPLLALWLVGAALVAHSYYRQRARWTGERLGMTHEVVEGLVGSRTRRAQMPRGVWHEEEDRELSRYAVDSHRLDNTRALLLAVVPRGWLLLGVLALMPAFIAGGAPASRLALAVGGVLAAFRGLGKLCEGLGHLAGAWISWRQVLPLVRAAAAPEASAAGAASAEAASTGPLTVASTGLPVLEASELHYWHGSRARAVLSGCSLTVAAGDRILLEGRSGCGKSTLMSLLTGLRRPDSGLLFLDGLDLPTVGTTAWRQRVASAPQFHENHVFTETFAFNLLLGRGWPVAPGDLEEAEAVCRELGLGPLLERMPSGLQQIVGETGWQLSHGEKSRLYIARALLQHHRVVVLDESLAALDPETMSQTLGCVLRRARSLVLVAHP